jgi:hypothetical protein
MNSKPVLWGWGAEALRIQRGARVGPGVLENLGGGLSGQGTGGSRVMELR